MRLYYAVTPALLALCCVDAVTGSRTLRRRQDSTNAATTTDSPSTQASATGSSTAAASSTATSYFSDASTSVTTSGYSAQDTTIRRSSVTADQTISPTSTVLDSTAASTASQTSSLATAAVPSATSEPNLLPLTPKITPALGVAGCILIIGGAALCLIGIKHKWLHIFLSTAFLASLAVSVLIIYVMNPPVSDAIQGAYMVAAVITGLIFGALALVFKDVTDGLGCLLGGFCLAMWFLVLSPGGLIDSTTGRAILIACFCLAFFGFSFSQYTRSYGLILGTSFGGAQITILGVDCFSRAGLKEFWLYIWNLNKNAFPINTTTYPITRGIRVEIACTIIMFIFGVLSQFKIWRVVKERRAKRDADRFREGADKDQLEEEVGRDIEASNQRDRHDWEAMYGEKDSTHVRTRGVDSGVGSSIETLPQKRSVSVREHEVESYEMADMPGAAGTSSKRAIRSDNTVDGPRDKSTQSEEHLIDTSAVSGTASLHSYPRQEHGSMSQRDDASIRSSQRQRSIHDGPAVVPLPFSIPTEDASINMARGSGSIVSMGTVGQAVNDRRGMPLKELLLRRDGHDDRVEDDRASSVAATADGDIGDDQLSAPRLSTMPSPYRLDFDKEGLLRCPNDEQGRSPSPGRSEIDVPLEEDDEEAIIRPGTALEESAPSPARPSPRRQHRKSLGGFSQRSIGKQSVQADTSEGDDNISLVRSLRDHLPQKLSKVALTYRTNEWAKHITDADQPAAEEEAESHSPGIQVDHTFAEEAARPVDVEGLKPIEDQPARTVSQRHSKNPYLRSVQPTPNTLQRATSGAATPVYSFQRSSSAMSLSTNFAGRPRMSTRKSSAPLMSQPLVESPAEDALAEPEPYRNLATPIGTASNHNLMGERQQRLLRRPTSTSFNALASSPDLNVVAPSDSASLREVALESPDADNVSLSDRKQMIDEESMTLAERKAMMQAQSPVEGPQYFALQDRSRSRQSSLPTPSGGPANQSNLIYDSHQPKRSNTVDTTKKVSMLTNWRQSMQQDVAAKQPLLVDDNARQAMLHERRQTEHAQQRQQAERAKRESAMDMAMRNGQFHGAHRDAMRRLQAKANKTVD